MAIPFRNSPLFPFGGISFDLGGGNEVEVKPHVSANGGPSRELSLPTITGSIPAADGADVFRWSDGGPKLFLGFPVKMIGIGDPDIPADRVAYIDNGSPSANRTHTLQNKDGVLAHKEDIPKDRQHIVGFGHATTNTSVAVKGGSAYIQSVDKIVEYDGGTFTYPGTIPNSQTIHFYLGPDGDISPSTIDPTSSGFGSSRYRTGRFDLRYIFSVRSLPLGNRLYLQRAVSAGNMLDVTFTNNTSAENAILTNGTSTSAADVSAAAYAPPGPTTDLVIRVYNSGSGGTVRLYSWDGSAFGIWSNIPVASELLTFSVPCDGSPKIRYDVAGTGASTQVALLGYRIER